MTSVGYATLDIIPSMRGIEGKLNSGLAGPMSSTGKKAGTVLGRGISSSVGSAAKGIALSLGAAFAAAKIKDFFGDAIDEGREAQKVTAQTAAVIKSTGGAARVTAGEVALLSAQISKKTGIDDEAIQSGANLLLTFTNLRNEAGKGNDIFNQATQIITDMGAALGTDARSSAVQLGKALNDPVKGITALTRVGVAFTDQQKEQITTLVESGKRLDAQKIILGELTKEFGGSAAAQATWGEKAKVVFDNVKEEVGTALLPVLDDLNKWFVKDGSDAIEHWVDWFKKDGIDGLRNFGDAGMDLLDDLKPLGASLLDTGREALPALTSGLKSAVPLLKTLADTFNSLPDGAQKLIVLGAGAAYMKRNLGPLGALLPGINGGIATLGTNTATAGANAQGAGGKFSGFKAALGNAGQWAAIAFAIGEGADRIGDIKALLSDPSVSDKKGLAGTLETIQNSDFADYADELGIDLDKLARSFQKGGDQGAYVQEVLGKLEGSIGKGGWKAFADTLIPADDALGLLGQDLGWNADQALAARGALMKLIPALQGVQDAAKGTSGKGWFIGLAGSLTGSTALVEQYGKQLRSLPRKAITEVLTPGALKSTQDVSDLAHNLDLTPKQTKTVMKILDFATPDIKKVLKGLDETDKKRPKPVVKADTAPAAASLRGLLGGPIKDVEKQRTSPVKANTDAAVGGLRALLTGPLKDVERPRTAHVKADIGQASGALAQIRHALDAVTGNFYATIFTTNVKKSATGGYISGPGSGTSDSIPALLSNGEYVVNAEATRRNRELLEYINAGRYAAGGQVGGLPTYARTPGSAVGDDFGAAAEAMRDLTRSTAGTVRSTKDWSNAQDFHKHLLHEENAELRLLNKAYNEQTKAVDQQREAVDESRDALRQLRQDANAFGQSVASNFKGEGFHPSELNGMSAWDALQLTLQNQAAQASAFERELRAAQGLGLSGGLFDYIAQSGDYGLASEFARMTEQQIAAAEYLFRDRNQAASSLGQFARDSAYGADIKGQMREVRQQTAELRRQTAELREVKASVKQQEKLLDKLEKRGPERVGAATARAINRSASDGHRRHPR